MEQTVPLTDRNSEQSSHFSLEVTPEHAWFHVNTFCVSTWSLLRLQRSISRSASLDIFIEFDTTRRCFRSHFRFISSQRYALEPRNSKKPEDVGDVGSESRWFCPGVRVRKGITIVLSLFWSHWLAVVYCWSFVAALVNRYTKTEPGRNSYIRFSLPSSQRNSQVRKSGKDEIPRQQRPVPL